MFESSLTPGQAKRSGVRLEPGARVEGTVLEISGGLVILDIGAAADATIDLAEFHDQAIKIGDRVRAIVKNARADAPELTLALGRGGSSLTLSSLQLAHDSGTPVSGTVTAGVKGGFTVDINGNRAFCPISQIDTAYVNDVELYVGQTFEFRIIEFKEGGRNLVVSRKALLEQERRAATEELLQRLSPGQTIQGTVKTLIRHGAVIDLGGAEGFIHISELARSRVEKPEDVLQIGETVETQVLAVESTERGPNIRLSLKALLAPSAGPSAAVEEILDGKVSRHLSHGLIVSTEKGEGFVPLRELSLPPGADARRAYPVDHELRVVVVNRDAETGKLRLSVTRVAQVEERQNYREFNQSAPGGASSSSLGSLGALLAEKWGHLAAPAASSKKK